MNRLRMATAAVAVLASAAAPSTTAHVTFPNRAGSPFCGLARRSRQGASLSLEQSLPAKRKSWNSSPLVCYYADEWIDADVELAFQTGGGGDASCATTPVLSAKSPLALFQRLLLRLSRLRFQLKELVRTRLERCTVYVLECDSGKYYVGSTTHRRRRYEEHFSRGKRGSKWTARHRPLRVLREHRRVPSKYLLGTESRVTAECMLEFGVNNVRGGMFCSARDYHMGDLDALTKFLGHYNNLSYRKVRCRLSEILPESPRQLQRRRNYYKRMHGRCYNCGRTGHLAADCPERHGKDANGGVEEM